MKRLGILLCFLLVLTSESLIYAVSQDGGSRSYSGSQYLIISSYNPETKRVAEFITQFEKEILDRDPECEILIEDLACKDFSEAYLWPSRIKNMLDKYPPGKLRAIILLGQEAWAAFIKNHDTRGNTPCFAVFASRNGIELPSGPDDLVSGWYPESADMVEKASKLGIFGGDIVEYDIPENIELILKIYHDTKNIVFISDNTYGGVSLQAYIKEEIKKYNNLSLILIDARISSLVQIREKVSTLPDSSVFLIGTWSVNREGLSMVKSTLRLIAGTNSRLPAFTLTGTGLGIVSLGGYIPKYGGDASVIVDQIWDFHSGERDSVRFVIRDGKYMFNKKKLVEMGIEEYRLPKDSIVEDSEDPRVSQYRTFVTILLAISSAMIFLVITLAMLYKRNRKLMNRLEKREKELITAKEKAEESDRLKGSFLANMSHEIRTPLNAIVGFSDLLAKGEFPPEEKAKYTDLIFKNSENLITLINDILDISRLESDNMKFVFEETEINNLCNVVLNTLLHQRKKELAYKFQPGMYSLVINTDPKRLSQVLINLMTNAIKFTEKGSVTLSYTVDENKNVVTFSVTDTGPGVSPAYQKNLFTRFVKLNEYKQGTGLGLAICKQIVTKLGGEIGIDPAYTDGARFFFTLPTK